MPNETNWQAAQTLEGLVNEELATAGGGGGGSSLTVIGGEISVANVSTLLLSDPLEVTDGGTGEAIVALGVAGVTADERAALDAAPTALTADNPVASLADLPAPWPLTADETAAIEGAASPSADNVMATMGDLPDVSNEPTVEEKAALDAAPTALTADNPVASMADLAIATYPDLSGDTGSATAPVSIAIVGSGGVSVDVEQPDGAGTAATATVTAVGSPYIGTTPDAPVALAPVDYLMSYTVDSPFWPNGYAYYDGPASDGVSATLTETNPADAGILSADGNSPTVGQRVAFYDGTYSGIYVVTDPGDGLTDPWVLTRAIDCDTVAKRERYWAAAILSGAKMAAGDVRVTDLTDGPILSMAADSSTASGVSSTASGSGSTASGTGSTASGNNSTASGNYSIASGTGSTASGYYSVASGYSSVASGSGSTASGYYSVASGSNSAASGNYSAASGSGSTASGYYSVASGSNSAASGYGSVASGTNSAASGSNSTASGSNSAASGNYSVASGNYSVASGSNSAASGSYSIAYSSGQTADTSNHSRTPLAVATIDDTPTPLGDWSNGNFTFQTTGITPVADYTRTAHVKGRVLARETDTPGTDSDWSFEGTIRGDGVSVYSWVGGNDPVAIVSAQDAGASTWAVAVTISGASIVITVTGTPATAINWACDLEVVEVSAPYTQTSSALHFDGEPTDAAVYGASVTQAQEIVPGGVITGGTWDILTIPYGSAIYSIPWDDEASDLQTLVDPTDTVIAVSGGPLATGPFYLEMIGHSGDDPDVITTSDASLEGVDPTLTPLIGQHGEAATGTITPPVTVQILDAFGNVCTTDNSTSVAVALTVPGGAVLYGTIPKDASAGVATFADLAVDTSGSYTLTATSGALATDESSSFAIGGDAGSAQRVRRDVRTR